MIGVNYHLRIIVYTFSSCLVDSILTKSKSSCAPRDNWLVGGIMGVYIFEFP
jgi:hypothetical protein